MFNASTDDLRTGADDIGFGKNEHKHTQKENGITMVLCIIAAICIWFYVMSIDSPTATETFSSVGVTVLNDRDLTIETPLTPISGTGSVIEVKLKGRKTLLNDLRAEDIEAYVDVGDVQSTGKAVYPVIVEAPEGTVIEDYYPREITVYMDKRSIVSVPVEAQLKQYSLVSGYTVNLFSPTLSIDSVQVSGPESELKKIDSARLVVSFPGTITRSFSSTGPLILVDENGNEVNTKYLTLSESEATAKYYVYTTKVIDLNVAYKYGFYAENGTKVTVSPNRVTVKGTVENLDTLDSLLVATIDETQIAEDGVHSYQLKLPEGVELVGETVTDTVSINIRFTDASLGRVHVPASQIEIVNLPEGKQAEILDKTLLVNVRGLKLSSKNLGARDFSVVVDASLASANGEQYVPASVSVRDGNTAALYTVGDYSIQLRISDAED